MPAKSFIYDFADTTSLHGAGKIIRSQSKCSRFFWTFVFFVSSVMFIYQFTQLLGKYFAYDTRFKMEIQKDAADFPLITLCKTQSLDLLTTKKLYKLFDNHDERERAELAKAENNSFILSFNSFYDKVVAKIDPLAQEHIAAGRFDWYPKMLFSFNKTTMEQGATRFEDFIVNSDTISKEHFSMEILYDGVAPSQCFTYHHHLRNLSQQSMMSSRSRISWEASIMFGRGMMPAVEDSVRVPPSVDKLIGILADRQTIEIYLHSVGNKPSLQWPERDIIVLPGYVASFAITVSTTERLGQPYGNCQQAYKFHNESRVPYVQAVCYDACVQNKIIARCGCKDSSLINYVSFFNISKIPYCDSFSDLVIKIDASDDELRAALDSFISRTGCATNISMNKTVSTECDLSCPRACSEYHFSVDKNMLKFSGRNRYINMTADKIMKNLLEREDTERFDLYKTFFQFNNLSTENSYNEFNYQTLSEEMSFVSFQLQNRDLSVILEVPDYTIYQLLSDIGGQLGLWIGMSVITLMELFELVVNTITLFCKKCITRDHHETVLESKLSKRQHETILKQNKKKCNQNNYPKLALRYRSVEKEASIPFGKNKMHPDEFYL